MTLKDWVANEMAKRIHRVLNQKMAWEVLDYNFFKEENQRGYFFERKEDSESWRKEYHTDIEAMLLKIENQNGVTEMELAHMKPQEVDLLIINNVAEMVLSEMPKDVEWETPTVWTKDLLKQSSFGKYMKQ